LILAVAVELPTNLSEDYFLKGIGVNKKYIVRLTADERKEMDDLLKK